MEQGSTWTLSDGKKYTVVSIVKEKKKKYVYLIDREEIQNYIIAEYNNDEIIEVIDPDLLEVLIVKFNEDYDICTSAKKEDLEQIFKVKLDDNYGSVVVLYKNLRLEITTFRKDIAYEGVRTPLIGYTDNLLEDLMRRDFTINAICLNCDGEYVDLLDGQCDLKNKLLKSIGDPYQKLKEDPLRILRAIRFASVLNFKIDYELEKAIISNASLIKKLSFFRKKQELDKIFNSCGIYLLKKYNLLSFLEIELNNVVEVSNNLGIWAQIKYSNKYRFSKIEINIIKIIKKFIAKKNITDYDLYRYDLQILKVVSDILNKDFHIEERYQQLPIKTRSDIDITYADIINNTSIFPSIIYKNLELQILNRKLVNKRENILFYLRKLSNYDIDK